MVDRSALYPGAVVTVRAKVVYVGNSGATVVACEPDKPPTTMGVGFSAILSVEDRPLAVGDRVRTPGGNRGRIVALGKGEACLVLEPTGFLSSPVLLAELTRLPEEPAPAEKAMRFKVGDRVDDRDIGRGTVTAIRYEVEFADGGMGWCSDYDLSPAPAEERAP